MDISTKDGREKYEEVPIIMVEFLKVELENCEGNLPVLLKLKDDIEYWRLIITAVDPTGIVVLRAGGQRECYAWHAVDAVAIAGPRCEDFPEDQFI